MSYVRLCEKTNFNSISYNESTKMNYMHAPHQTNEQRIYAYSTYVLQKKKEKEVELRN